MRALCRVGKNERILVSRVPSKFAAKGARDFANKKVCNVRSELLRTNTDLWWLYVVGAMLRFPKYEV